MESDDGLRTVECLRGRLLAERQASRTAKQDAQLMENKLMELEKELKDETKLRDKTEKRLKLLMKKLESLNLLPSFEEVSEHCAVSCVSSTGSSCTKSPEISKIMEEKSSVESSSGHEDTKVDDHTSSSSLKASTMDHDGDDDYVDNSLALVPILILPETKVEPEMKMVSKSIGEVLDTLRHARERIQSSMKRRHMIRVGPF